jgi:hypothetical protein
MSRHVSARPPGARPFGARHVSAEKIARWREGDLRPATARRVAAHLRGCTACQAESDALAALPGLLASARLPPVPAHLAARIETALATESAQRAADAVPGARAARSPADGMPAVPLTRARRYRPGSPRPVSSLPGPARRVLATAAVIVVIGGGGYAVFATLGRPGPGVSGAAPAAGPGTSAPSAVPSALPRAAASSLIGGVVHPGVAGQVTFGPVTSYRSGGRLGQFTPVLTATDYQPGQLGRQAATALAAVRGGQGAGRAAGPSGPSGPATSRRPAASAPASSFGGIALSRLSGCVGRVAGGASVLLVNVAAYRGQQATIIVTAGSPARVWVVGPACSASVSDVLARQPLP